MQVEGEEENFVLKKYTKKKSRKRKAASFIDVKLSQATNSKCAKLRNEQKKELKQMEMKNLDISFSTDNSDVEYDMDDFYSETHEEQDPRNSILCKNNEMHYQIHELEELNRQVQIERMEIMKKLDAKWTTHLMSFRQRVKDLEKKMSSRQAKQREELVEHDKKNLRQLEERNNLELKNLMEKNQAMIDKINSKYQQVADRNGNLTPQVAQMRKMELQDLQNQLTQARNAHQAKMKKYLMDCEIEKEKKFRKLSNHHDRRRAELEMALRKLTAECQESHEQLKLSMMKTHTEKFRKKRENILRNGTKFNKPRSDNEISTSTEKDMNDRQSFIFRHTKVGAAARMKRRKTHFNRASIAMTIEIHNEGLIVSFRNENLPEEGEGEPQDACITNDFIPWGYTARNFLFSVACGECPNHSLMDKCNLTSTQMQIKCLVADMRVKNDTAAEQWSSIPAEKTTDSNLTQKAELLKAKLSNNIKAEQECNEELKKSFTLLEKANRKLSELRSRANEYFNGRTVATKNDDMVKLSQILAKGKEVVENADQDHRRNSQKMKTARSERIKTTEAYKLVLTKMVDTEKVKSKDLTFRSDNEDDAVNKFLSGLQKVAAQRKPLHNRRAMIVLRSPRVSTKDAKLALQEILPQSQNPAVIEEKLIRAEQLLLLSMHPSSTGKQLSSAPLDSSTGANAKFAEPGWHLNLEVPSKSQKKNSFLQYRKEFNLFSFLFAEGNSSQGHQLATISGSRNLLPLCIESDGTSLQDPSLSTPLTLTEKEIDKAYVFSNKKNSSSTNKKGNARVLKPLRRKNLLLNRPKESNEMLTHERKVRNNSQVFYMHAS